MSPPHARSWLCPHLPIDTHCTHVRAGLLLLRASVPRPRPAAPFPPVLPAARANGTRAALVARLHKQPGGRFFFQERSFSAETASALRYRLLPLQRCRRSPSSSGLQLASLLEHARTRSQGCSALRDAEACRCRGSPSDGVGGMVARRSRMSSPNLFQGRDDEDSCDRSAFRRLLT